MATEPQNDNCSGPHAAQGRQGLLCVAVGTDPAGRERRIKIKQTGESFMMMDSRRRCRINAHWSRQLTDEDIASEVWFVFRVKVNTFEFPGDTQQYQITRPRRLKGKYWKSWGRKISLTRSAAPTTV